MKSLFGNHKMSHRLIAVFGVVLSLFLGAVVSGARLVLSAGDTMRDILRSVLRVNEIIREIRDASHHQNDDIGEVAQTIRALDRVTRKNVTLVGQSAASAESSRDDAHQLMQAVSVFCFDACAI